MVTEGNSVGESKNRRAIVYHDGLKSFVCLFHFMALLFVLFFMILTCGDCISEPIGGGDDI